MNRPGFTFDLHITFGQSHRGRLTSVSRTSFTPHVRHLPCGGGAAPGSNFFVIVAPSAFEDLASSVPPRK